MQGTTNHARKGPWKSAEAQTRSFDSNGGRRLEGHDGCVPLGITSARDGCARSTRTIAAITAHTPVMRENQTRGVRGRSVATCTNSLNLVPVNVRVTQSLPFVGDGEGHCMRVRVHTPTVAPVAREPIAQDLRVARTQSRPRLPPFVDVAFFGLGWSRGGVDTLCTCRVSVRACNGKA